MTGQGMMKQLRKLAQYKSNDAVKLVFLSEEDVDEIDGLDLTGLVELKRNNNGTVELKLVDRLRVLELMDKIGQRENESDLGAFLSGLGKGEEM